MTAHSTENQNRPIPFTRCRATVHVIEDRAYDSDMNLYIWDEAEQAYIDERLIKEGLFPRGKKEKAETEYAGFEESDPVDRDLDAETDARVAQVAERDLAAAQEYQEP